MLANPRLAPFELIEGMSCQQQDWTLIDHLMVIYRVRESDYVQNDPRVSIRNMARTLAHSYVSEDSTSRVVVLVKDGGKSPKPAVRENRMNRTLAPHIEFCKHNLSAIEYTMMKLLADVGMKEKLFLVTGAKADYFEHEVPAEKTLPSDNLVCFHQKYLEYRRERGDDGGFGNVLEGLPNPAVDELFDDDPSNCTKGSIDRPQGLEGVFMATFADPETTQATALREACARCTSTEADTLLVELANILKGSVTVCTGDSDIVAVLAACGREGITLRMDNKSYHEHRDMHASPFGELLATPDHNPSKLPLREFSSSEDSRFRALCDVAVEDEHLLSEAREQHGTFEAILDKRGEVGFKEKVARRLYLGGVRGCVYHTFLSRFLGSSNIQSCLDSLGLAVDRCHIGGDNTVRYIFETLCPATSDDSLPSSQSESDTNPQCTGHKRKVSRRQDELELSLDDGIEPEQLSPSGERQKGEGVANSLKRLGNTYVKGMVPQGSYGRFLRLRRAGQHFFMRITGDTVRDEHTRTEKLFFMALCGTDYNLVPVGLGIKRLMTGVLTNYKSFSSWCHDLKSLLWGCGGTPSDSDYHAMGTRLSRITKVPASICAKHWKEENCRLMVKTIKYVCELWNLKKPRPGPEYGFRVREAMVSFDREDICGPC
ncbi:hypothetical protein D5F01_LYC23977 [Larimichthys crocea]|uniref:Uncharacterized protein n=1 Tax=Larimichthys crocea TaxID=215358 RepID=A0A6G0HDI2_LARCR|nr:hypothetical protein D5F01_LYC25095 [Larimichthys crocea]KAE8277980.1 hypothetical protein D5F01_LYC23977 [Larimichthys crocea]